MLRPIYTCLHPPLGHELAFDPESLRARNPNPYFHQDRGQQSREDQSFIGSSLVLEIERQSMREQFWRSLGLSVLSLRFVPGGIKFFLSLLLRFLWQLTSNSSKHLVHIVLQVCDSLLSTLILVAPGLKQYSQCKRGAQTRLLIDVPYFLDRWQLTRVTFIASLNPLQSTSH